MPLHFPFDNTYAQLPNGFFTRLSPTPVRDPKLIRFNSQLAEDLRITPGTPDEQARVLSGNLPPEGAHPLAQAYAGHQFGGFSPQLGDGRAILLGEVIDGNGTRRDVQLKGSGPTPYSRMGDGRAWLGPVLREYLVSEAMHAMGVPTSRALAAVTTGEAVYREEGGMPGAILTRVATSHIRIGTFQYFAARRDMEGLKTLYDYVINRHYPECRTPTELLNGVIERQAKLVAGWMSVGFIHGVMNTDNTTISGETIDYGPCAFMDNYNPGTVFSSIDAHGRYSYENQTKIIVWNLAQLATSLVPLMPNTDAAIAEFTEVVHTMPDVIEKHWLQKFGAKIGIKTPRSEDSALINELLTCMVEERADFTNTFRALSKSSARDQFTDPARFDDWELAWRKRLLSEDTDEQCMRNANPAFIPRNHRIEEMIQQALSGDFTLFERMLTVLSTPYDDQPDEVELQRPPEPSEIVYNTFCGT